MTGSGTHRRPSRSADRLPLLAAVDRRSVRADLLAAVTVTAVLIPSGLAYGELAGLSPVAGLYTACLGMVGYALLATSRVLIVGPESQMTILVDTNGVQALDQLVELTRRREVTLALARVSGPLEQALRRGGVWEGIGDEHVYDRGRRPSVARRAPGAR